MLILDYPDWIQSTLSFKPIPKAAYEMTPEVSVVDKLLEDETYEEPIIKRFNTLRGRPTVPVRVFIRMIQRNTEKPPYQRSTSTSCSRLSERNC